EAAGRTERRLQHDQRGRGAKTPSAGLSDRRAELSNRLGGGLPKTASLIRAGVRGTGAAERLPAGQCESCFPALAGFGIHTFETTCRLSATRNLNGSWFLNRNEARSFQSRRTTPE